ncbi:NADH-quinone oxidoreductase subunit I [Thermosphaera sp.]
MGFKETGVLTLQDMVKAGLMPTEERLRKGPVALLECPEQIPCNICVSACPFKAISMDKVYDLPRLDENKCIGCGVCVAKCPGLAIFVIDISKSDKAYITLPYEFLPRPSKGARVKLLNREGKVVGEGIVVKTWEYEKTWVVTVEVEKDLWFDVRAIKVEGV